MLSNICYEEAKNLTSGKYIIGCNPADECGVSNNMFLEED
jgi:hypothetical protein